MNKLIKIIMLLLTIFVLSSCGKKPYVLLNYNCNGTEYHKCELKSNKLNCKIEIPVCGDYEFKGWYQYYIPESDYPDYLK